MVPVLTLVFLVLPIAELAVLIAVADRIGLGSTIFLLIAVSAAGAYLAKREGLGAWRRFRVAVAEGRIPSREVADGFLILFGAALLLTPGFITDALGLTLLFPASRAGVRRALRKGSGLLILKRFPLFGAVGAVAKRSRPAEVVEPDLETGGQRLPGGDSG